MDTQKLSGGAGKETILWLILEMEKILLKLVPFLKSSYSAVSASL